MKFGTYLLVLTTSGLFQICCDSYFPETEAMNSNQSGQFVTNANTTNQTVKAKDIAKLMTFYRDGLKFFGEWEAGGVSTYHYYVMRGNSNNSLIVFDSSGKTVFAKDFADIAKVYTSWILRTENAQLVFEYDEGGQDSFVQILSLTNGKVREIIDDSPNENRFRGGITIQPRSYGTNSVVEPFDIFLTDSGLASPQKHFTRVLRFSNEKFRTLGRFNSEAIWECVQGRMVQVQ